MTSTMPSPNDSQVFQTHSLRTCFQAKSAELNRAFDAALKQTYDE